MNHPSPPERVATFDEAMTNWRTVMNERQVNTMVAELVRLGPRYGESTSEFQARVLARTQAERSLLGLPSLAPVALRVVGGAA